MLDAGWREVLLEVPRWRGHAGVLRAGRKEGLANEVVGRESADLPELQHDREASARAHDPVHRVHRGVLPEEDGQNPLIFTGFHLVVY